MYLELTLASQQSKYNWAKLRSIQWLNRVCIPSKFQGNLYLTICIFQFPKGKVKNVFTDAISVKLGEEGGKKVIFSILWFISFCQLKLVLLFAQGIS